MISLLHLLIDIENQGATGYCGRYSSTTYLEAIWLKFKGEKVEFSTAFLVTMTNEMKGRAFDANEGIDGGMLMQCLVKYGCPTEKTWPSTPENFKRRPSPEAFADARNHRIKKWAQCDTPELAYKYMQTAGIPVLFRIYLPKGWVGIHGPRETHPAQWDALGKPQMNLSHFLVAIEGDGLQTGFVSSSGLGWADKGISRANNSTLVALHFNGFVITKFPNVFDRAIDQLMRAFRKQN